MDFLTIHEVSRQFDIPSRMVRYRIHQLMQAGKLVEGGDCRRDDFVDDQHFVWRINLKSFHEGTRRRRRVSREKIAATSTTP